MTTRFDEESEREYQGYSSLFNTYCKTIDKKYRHTYGKEMKTSKAIFWDESKNFTNEEWDYLLRRAHERAYKGVTDQMINCKVNKKGNIIQTLMHPDQYKHYKRDFMPITQNEKNKRFTNAGGKLPDQHKPEDKKLHFATILSNPDKYIWRASRDRIFKIRQTDSVIKIDIPSLEDKHLINVMRYLVLNWPAMQDVVFIEIEKFNKAFPAMTLNLLRETKAAHFLEGALNCWPTLCNETVERFGSDALLSLLDGN